MKIHTRREPEVCILELHGKLAQPDGTADLRSQVQKLEEAGDHRLVLDLRNVPWIDSGEIVACYTRAQDLGGTVKLVLPEQPLSGFSYAQLEPLFEVFDTPEDAVASFSG